MTKHTHIKAGLVAALAGSALMVSACGESEPEAAKPAARPAKVDLTQFLMRDDEQPGFRRVERAVTESAETFAENSLLTPAEKEQLREAGMGESTFQPIEGPSTRGVTSVTLFASAKGAASWMTVELSRSYIRRHLPERGRLRYFDVPGIPSARGWATTKGSHEVGNVFWVQGRCMMVLGNEGPGPIAGPLSTGARAIHARTKGQCPSTSAGDADATDLAALVDEPTLAGITSASVEEQDDPLRFAVANCWAYNVDPGDAFALGKRLEQRGFVAGAAHYYGHVPGVPTQTPPRQMGYRSVIRFHGADAAEQEAHEQAAGAFKPCPGEKRCATSRLINVSGIPEATAAALTRTVHGDRRYEYVVVFTKGDVVGQVWASSNKKDLEDEITAAAEDLYESIESEGT